MELAKRAESLREAFDAIRFGVALVDSQGILQTVNPHACALLGRPASEIVGRSIFDFVHPDEVGEFRPLANDLAARRLPSIRVDRRVRRPDQTVVHLRVSIAPFLDDAGLPDGYLGLFEDVTAEFDAMAALEASEARFRAVVENASDAILVYDRDGHVIYASDSCGDLLGFAPEELRLEPEAAALRAQLFAAGTAGPVTHRLVHNGDGRERVIEAVTTDLLDDPAVHGLVVHCRDVTDRVRGVEALRASEERYRSVVETIDEVVFQTDSDGRWTFLNPAFVNLVGRPVEDMIGRPAIDLVHPDDQDRMRELVRSLSRGVRRSDAIEVRYFDHGGSQRWCEVRCQAVVGPTGQLAGMSGVISDVTARKLAEARLTHLALHDPLTGLPNRTLLIDRLNQAMLRSQRLGGGLAVLFVDLDHFKVVNDNLGHAVGDNLLRMVASRLLDALRGSQTIARFGGDEFVIVAEGLTSVEVARSIGDRVLHVLREPVALHGGEYVVSVSVGISFAPPLPPGVEPDPAALIRDADMAMYLAKERGRSRVEVFEGGLRERAARRMTLEGELRRAIDDGQLVPYFQPVCNLRHGYVAAFEALARWHHPERGLLLPTEFIPIAEETGLIVPIGRMLAEAAIQEACRWPTSAGRRTPPKLAVNLSAREVADPRLADDLRALVERHHLPIERLKLELTESTMLVDPEASRAMLDRLADMGIGMGIDDFGTGYSSLAYLRDLPVETIKIDRTFVAAMERSQRGRSLVAAVVSIGRALGLVVVAEGVETMGQLSALISIGCDRVQGNLVGVPVPADQVLSVIETWLPPVPGPRAGD